MVSATIDEKKLELAEKIAPIIYKRELQEIEDQNILNKSKYYFVNFQMTDSESKEYILLGEEMQSEMHEIQEIERLLNGEGDSKKIKSLQYKLFRHKKSMEFLTIKRKHFLNALESSSLICNRLMRDIYLEDKSNRMLVFCELNKQADTISRFSYHSETAKDGHFERFRNGEINVLAVCGKINRGINLIGVNNIIFESCNRSKTQLTQRIGRGKRLKTDDILHVYFLVPFYMTRTNKLKPTKVREWIYKAAKDLDLSKAQTYKFKH